VTHNSATKSTNRTLGIFAKFWEPGRVKTRLAKTIGHDAASSAYQCLLGYHIRRFSGFDSQSVIVYSPDTPPSLASFEDFTHVQCEAPGWDLIPQSEGDLGVRMATFFQQRFDLGDQKIVVIGSDAPQLSESVIENAFSMLDDHEVVFGPSTDGGYYLVGLSRFAPEIFTGIDWSTESVLPQSTAQCEQSGYRCGLLEPLTDIDEGKDLAAVMQSLAADSNEHVGELLTKLNAIPEVKSVYDGLDS